MWLVAWKPRGGASLARQLGPWICGFAILSVLPTLCVSSSPSSFLCEAFTWEKSKCLLLHLYQGEKMHSFFTAFWLKKENPIFYWDESSQFNHLKGWLFLIVLDQLGSVLPWIVFLLYMGEDVGQRLKRTMLSSYRIFLPSCFYFSSSKITEYLCSKTVVGLRIIIGPQPTDRLRDPAPFPCFSKPLSPPGYKTSI